MQLLHPLEPVCIKRCRLGLDLHMNWSSSMPPPEARLLFSESMPPSREHAFPRESASPLRACLLPQKKPFHVECASSSKRACLFTETMSIPECLPREHASSQNMFLPKNVPHKNMPLSRRMSVPIKHMRQFVENIALRIIHMMPIHQEIILIIKIQQNSPLKVGDVLVVALRANLDDF